jgi:hypothetical protein
VTSARSASASAEQAGRAASSASASASAALAQAAKARTDAQNASHDASAAAQAHTDALASAAEAQRREQQQHPGGQPEKDQPIEGNGVTALRPGNVTGGNDALALLAVKMWGGQCFPGQLQMICTGVNTPNGRPMTVGDFLLYPGNRAALDDELRTQKATREQLRSEGINADLYGPDLLTHEAAHSGQWNYFKPWEFVPLYFGGTAYSELLTGTDGDGNPFEIGANPWKGGYWDPHESPIDVLWQPIWKRFACGWSRCRK